MATGQKTTLTTQDARQGDTGHGVRYVLGIGLALAVLAMICVMTFTT
jgi:hypothetical protein